MAVEHFSKSERTGFYGISLADQGCSTAPSQSDHVDFCSLESAEVL
jgi:hypothetical protein